jgi:hypothetical protein
MSQFDARCSERTQTAPRVAISSAASVTRIATNKHVQAQRVHAAIPTPAISQSIGKTGLFSAT